MAQEKNIVSKIKEVIKTKIRPVLVMDGGNIEYVDFNNNVLSVKLLGSCNGCPMASLTLKNTVAYLINEELKSNITVQALDFSDGDDELKI